MPKVSSAPMAIEQRRCNSGHVSRANKFSIKHLQAVNVCNDLLTICSVQTEVVRGYSDNVYRPPNRPYK
jgi:hypothetical protein